jgi:hypothetical protein
MIKSYSTNVPPAGSPASGIVALRAETVHHGFTLECQSLFSLRQGNLNANFSTAASRP